MMYANRATLSIDSHGHIQRKHQTYKRGDFTADELDAMGYALLDESAPIGHRATGGAVLVDGVYYREYVDQTPAEAAAQRQAALAATDADMPRAVEDLIGTLIGLGVIAETDLPQVTQDRLADKRDKRAAL